MSTGNDIAIDKLKISKMKMIEGIAVFVFVFIYYFI